MAKRKKREKKMRMKQKILSFLLGLLLYTIEMDARHEYRIEAGREGALASRQLRYVNTGRC